MSADLILVGTDGSDEQWQVLKWAIARAAQSRATLKILVAYNLASYTPSGIEGSYMPLDDGQLREQATETAQKAVDMALRAGVPHVSSEVVPGDPATLLLEGSEEASMVVIGTQGSSGLADRLFGAVSATVPSRAKCPVVVVPRFQGGSPYTPVRRMVVGVDGSDTASTALRVGIKEAELWNAKLTVASAVPFATGNSLMAWVPPIIDRARVIEDIRTGLDVSVDQALEGRQMDVARHVLDGNPAELLAEFSTAVDLIVVGRRGRGGFAGLLLGSTSQTLLAHSTCPVMIVPTVKDAPVSENESDTPRKLPWERA
ncbi:universal stress protein [Boudabousia liubingyangii]|uniref:Universal stress protein n=1 Tax=Boudabousia liubingyangii TaxID=1921764 RepID=A0A1Q5PLC0_9ACTO|nr:universal stress protein [Boudabousia liubingyangii]OKL47088.1 universal stress protein [Boudabousia liubingyangii]OKL47849.1 universal stress protein [Boudabousia liubingyangii]